MSEPGAASKSERTKPIEWVTFISVVALGLSNLYSQWQKQEIIEKPQMEKANQKIDHDIALDRVECLSIEGEVLDPNLVVEGIPLCPVVVRIHNKGKLPVDISSMDFRVFVASIRDVSIIENTQHDGARGIWPVDGPQVGIIDDNAAAWREIVKLNQKPSGRRIHPGQEHVERFHLLSPRDFGKIVTRVSVSVHTHESEVSWSGYANPAMCRAVAPSQESADSGDKAQGSNVTDANALRIQDVLASEIGKPSQINAAIDELRVMHAELMHLVKEIDASKKLPQNNLEIDKLITKEIAIMSADGKTQVGKISSEPVSTYLVVNPETRRIHSDLVFEIGRNSRLGGSMIVRHPRNVESSPIGIEIRAWNDQAAVLLVNEKGESVGKNNKMDLPASLIWNSPK